MIRHFSLFSGIESFKKALDNLKIDNELVGYSEIDPYAVEALSAIHGVSTDLNFGDITKVDEKEVPDCDLITYGFPCQDISVAGLGKGIVKGKTRSGLLYDALRIIEHKKPKWAVAENVKNLVGEQFIADFNNLLITLDEMGYNNYWEVLNSKDYGIPQNRERVFIVSIRKDIDNRVVDKQIDLFQDPNDFREVEEVDDRPVFSEKFDSGLRLKDLLEDEVEEKYYIDNERVNELIERLKDDKKESYSNLEKIVCEQRTDEGLRFFKGGVVGTLRTIDSCGDKRVLEPNELKLHTNLSGGKWDKIHESARRVYDEEGIAPTVPTCGGGNIEPKIAIRETTKKGYAIATVGDSINLEQPNSKTRRGRVGKEVAQTLTTSCNQAALEHGYKIRKLTPKECWRLMGFTDEDYHKAKERLEEVFYNGADRSNSQMYKMAGNSIVVDVIESIFKNLF